MRISDWSSDVCSSDLDRFRDPLLDYKSVRGDFRFNTLVEGGKPGPRICGAEPEDIFLRRPEEAVGKIHRHEPGTIEPSLRSEEHTSELQSLMRISYAVFCLKKKTINKHIFLPIHQ